MKIGLLTRSFCALLLTSVGVANAVPFGSAGQGKSGIHKLEEAGIQFTTPLGWEVKAEKDGVKVVPKETHSLQVVFIPLPIPTDMKSEQKEEFFNSVAAKSGVTEQALGEYKGHESVNGIPVALRPFEGKNNGHDVVGAYYLVSADKLVFIVLVADKSVSDDLGNEAVGIVKSIKKIE
jgi:hypothetical protein